MKKSFNTNMLGIVKFIMWALALVSAFYIVPAYADAGADGIGGVAVSIKNSFADLAQLITSGSYIAGMGFGVGAILKFKAHKDNPTQIPIGTPIALLFIAAALLFMPTIFHVAGGTLFGTSGSQGGVTGVTTF